MFFEKLNFFFSKKAKLVTLCHHLGKARVKSLTVLVSRFRVTALVVFRRFSKNGYRYRLVFVGLFTPFEVFHLIHEI